MRYFLLLIHLIEEIAFHAVFNQLLMILNMQKLDAIFMPIINPNMNA